MQTVDTQRLQEIRDLVKTDLHATDRLIVEELVSEIPLIQTITSHILKSGGKRLRPLLVILSAKAFAYAGREHLELAAIIEFVHTATLLHDDVVDDSELRRGQKTANAMWGNASSVLVGDFLYSRAFQLLTRRSNVAIMKVLANTTNAIAEGEVLQLMNRNDPEINESTYLQVIHRKTAALFQAAGSIGAILGTDNPQHQNALSNYGLQLGMTFQIIDDLLDYTASSDQMGKNVGDDLAEGKATLPLIYAIHHAKPEHQRILKEAIHQGGLDQLDVILETLEETQAKEYCFAKAKEYAEAALNSLDSIPDNAYRDALEQLVQFAVERSY